MIKNILFISTLLAVASSCERNTLVLPDSSGNDPVFRLEMNVDNTPVQVVAGVEDMYNHTDYNLDQDEVYTFSGQLASVNCNAACADSYRFKVRNYQNGTDGIVVNESLSKRSYAFKYDQAPTQDALELELNINTEAIKPQFTWVIDGAIFTQQDFSSKQIINVDADKEIFATLSVFDESTGLTSYNNRQIHLDENIEGVSSHIEVRQVEADSVELTIVHSSSADFMPVSPTFWGVEDLDGKNPQADPFGQDKFSIRIGEGKSIKNKTIFFTSEGTETSVGMQILYDPTTDAIIYHDASYDYLLAKRIGQGSDLALQSFEFEMTDTNGTVYSSAKGEQTEEAIFEILDIEPYLENDKGQKTVKLTCAFTCQVFAADGSVKQINDAQAVIAVAIP